MSDDINEGATRLAALRAYDVLDTPPEPQFDDIVRLAQTLCATPIALMSLVAADRQWFKARIGLEAHETPLDQSVCIHALKERDLLVIPDLTQDERTRINTLVTGGPRLRFYAGAVLRTPEGQALGALCVIDTKPRPGGLTADQKQSLLALARQTMLLLQYRRALSHRIEAVESAQRAGGVGIFEIDIASGTLLPSSEFCHLFGLPARQTFAATEIERLVLPEDRDAISSRLTRASGTAPLDTQYRIRRPSDGKVRWIGRRGAFEHDATGRPTRLRGVVQDITQRKHLEARQQMLSQELSHRMKNALALVNAIATQTLHHVADQAALEAFSRRIMALGKAQEVLLAQSMTGAPIRSAIEGVVGLLVDPRQVVLKGPEIDINARSVLSFSLLIHELATNATKYGALSKEGGRVVVDWRIEDTVKEAELVLAWREEGGPAASPPERRGFGSRLIQSGLAGTGHVDIRYESAGLQAEFRAPLAFLTHS
ncbi:MAG: PAS domain-containing protein [Proteobacteria bacterium]|nr:PAS domain-containing protein [Pseudomonadota bacterium]